MFSSNYGLAKLYWGLFLHSLFSLGGAQGGFGFQAAPPYLPYPPYPSPPKDGMRSLSQQQQDVAVPQQGLEQANVQDWIRQQQEQQQQPNPAVVAASAANLRNLGISYGGDPSWGIWQTGVGGKSNRAAVGKQKQPNKNTNNRYMSSSPKKKGGNHDNKKKKTNSARQLASTTVPNMSTGKSTWNAGDKGPTTPALHQPINRIREKPEDPTRQKVLNVLRNLAEDVDKEENGEGGEEEEEDDAGEEEGSANIENKHEINQEHKHGGIFEGMFGTPKDKRKRRNKKIKKITRRKRLRMTKKKKKKKATSRALSTPKGSEENKQQQHLQKEEEEEEDVCKGSKARVGSFLVEVVEKMEQIQQQESGD